MVHYYTEFMGMRDTITQDDLIDADEKTLIQKKLDEETVTRQLMEERMKAMEQQLQMMHDMLADKIEPGLHERYPKEVLLRG